MTSYQRHVAKRVLLRDLLESSFMNAQVEEPDYLLTGTGQKIVRCQIMGVVVGKEQIGSMANILLDDGTGKLMVRFFEENKIFDRVIIGDCLLVVGRVRVYNEEKYISAEITKKVEPRWLQVSALYERKKNILESNTKKEAGGESDKSQQQDKVQERTEEKESEKNIVSLEDRKLKNSFQENQIMPFEEMMVEEDQEIPFQKLVRLIKELDKGDGVAIESLLEKSSLDHTEQYIQQMMERGDIFQVRPGKIKVL
ncbi:MAG: OB-fold nucleic acid binding domain-containing protein [Nanoarchaeota archaeon]|nr:OB-fold nucleic acid binding domain-containing protein [Nanoarchaeota archaeon]